MMSSYKEAREINLVVNTDLTTLQNAHQALRAFHDAGHTKSYASRINVLKALKECIVRREKDIKDALYNDFRKPGYEAYLSDIGVVTDELNHTIRHLKSWMKPKYVSTPLAIFPGYKSRLYPESKGVVAIFAPWNYPVNLTFIPLISAIAAGNTVMVKPAHETPNTARVIAEIIGEVFPPEHVFVVTGEGAVVGPAMLENLRFDHIFFTGSQAVGKYVMSKAAENLTPVTLELGGKNPAIIDKNCNLPNSVNRLVWGKFFNAGQTCIAPDYLLIHEEVFDETIRLLKKRIQEQFGEDPQKSPDFARIINEQRCNKIISYLSQGEILHGGRHQINECYVEPTIIRVRDYSLPIIHDEIFGPVWPVTTWKTYDELLALIRKNRYPLSTYLYSNQKKTIDFILNNVEFGTGCINDNMIQFANNSIPFGGIQQSGNGRYHGKTSFETFSNIKGVVTSLSWLDHGLKYAPYKKWQETIAKFFLQ